MRNIKFRHCMRLFFIRSVSAYCVLTSVSLFTFSCKSFPTATPHPPTAPTHTRPVLNQIEELPRGIPFANPKVETNTKDPTIGARYVYQRLASQNARQSPMDIEIILLDAKGEPLHTQLHEEIHQIYQTIYGWDPKQWEMALKSHAEKDKIMTTKSNFFWESLAQHVAEYVFDHPISPSIYIYGPKGPNETIKSRFKRVHVVIVRTHIDGQRDPLNPVTRSIIYKARRDKMEYPEILLDLDIPINLNIASVYQENLDMRPKVAGSYDTLHSIHVHARIPSTHIKRVQNHHYPDFNLLYIPLRHLVFQGPVDDPTRSKSTLHYSNLKQLKRKAKAVITALRGKDSVKPIIKSLKEFITHKYYYMFRQGVGIESYRRYILGPHGIAGSISPHIKTVELQLN